MRFSAEDYRAAAKERIEAARAEYLAGRFPESIYLAGLATEAILRAYRCRSNPEFDSRHDLKDLLKTSSLQEFVPQKRRKDVSSLLGDIWTRWKNDYRFASTDRLVSEFKKRKLYGKGQGDPLKEQARIVLDSSYELVGIGDARWSIISKHV